MSATGEITPLQNRHNLLDRALDQSGLQGLALNAGPSLIYLTGLHFHLSERPTVFLFSPGKKILAVLPELEAGKLSDLAFEVEGYTYNDNPESWPKAYRRAAQAAGLDGRRIGVEPRRMRLLELDFLREAAPQAAYVTAEACLASLRMHKDQTEVAAMRRAVQIAQTALRETLPQIRAGMTERELAAELTLHLLRNGSEPELPFFPIVASGPNSANPHAFPTERALAQGDLLILDWGAAYQGYASDLTRTFAIGEPEDELARVAQIVAEANSAARAKAGPDVQAGEVDRAARAVIEKAGYGQYFIHRTGHGLGLESHEDPYIRGDNQQRLEQGMTFTIEPGIYLPGRGGVRVEDDFLITADSGESLSDLPRELVFLDV